MDIHTLQQENQVFRGTAGISRNNADQGFRPGFLHKQTGRVELARDEHGDPATLHMIGWLPREWAATTAPDGQIRSLVSGIIAGFVLDGVFYTREEAAEL
jgi:hypothetical protein